MSTFFTFYRELLSSSFNSAIINEYFHHLAKHKTSPSVYDPKKLEKVMSEIKGKLGECSLSRQESHLRVSPLQVAYIYGNLTAIKFFESRTDQTIEDIYARTIQNYKEFISMEHIFTSLPMRPIDVEAIRKIFSKCVPLVKRPFTYRANSNDFGKMIKQIFFSGPASKKHNYLLLDNIIMGIKKVAEEEGFTVRLAEKNCWPRDYLIYTGSGECTLISSIDKTGIETALTRSESLLIATGQYSPPSLNFFKRRFSKLGSTNRNDPLPFLNSFLLQSKKQISSIDHLYFEGGNCFCVTNTEDKKKVLIGQTHFHAAHMQLRIKGYFKQNPPKLKGSLSEDEICQGAEEMYYLGILNLNNHSGLITKDILEKVFNEQSHNHQMLLKPISQIAKEKGWLKAFKITSENYIQLKPLVENYLAEKKTTLRVLAQAFKASEEDLHFIPYFENHLDLFMLPGPKGSIFLQDFDLIDQLLSELENPQFMKDYGLTYNDITPIAEYRATIKAIQEEATPLLQKIKKILETAGFTVIPTPGIFYVYSSANYSGNFNFLNALTGWSEENQRYFYITTGVHIPGSNLGQALMKLYEEFLKSYIPNIKVHFVGENPKKRGDFSEAMLLWNETKEGELGGFGGIHCLSLEEETEDHKD